MLVVPLRHDSIESVEGISFKVLSYTNYKKGPAVYVEHTPSVPSDAVYFFDIRKINGKTVEFKRGMNVFNSLGPLKRRYQLPQINDKITWKGPLGVTEEIIVKGLKLHSRKEKAKGLLVVGEDPGTDERRTIRLIDIIELKRGLGNDLFSRDGFLTYYKDYLGVT